jgi:hypothetical protein
LWSLDLHVVVTQDQDGFLADFHGDIVARLGNFRRHGHVNPVTLEDVLDVGIKHFLRIVRGFQAIPRLTTGNQLTQFLYRLEANGAFLHFTHLQN